MAHERFDRQAAKWNAAVWSNDLERVRAQAGGMTRAWQALDAAAEADGAETLNPTVWEARMPDGRVFGLLEAAGQEAETAVGGEGARSANILLRNFDDEALSDALARRRFDVVHLATHASFEGRTDRSFIVTNGETIPLAELRRLYLTRLDHALLGRIREYRARYGGK